MTEINQQYSNTEKVDKFLLLNKVFLKVLRYHILIYFTRNVGYFWKHRNWI